jgi:hypothetical protein
MTDPFEDVRELDEVAAIVLHKAGEEGLQELCRRFTDESVLGYQDLVKVADKLRKVGLAEGADIVTEAAEAAKDTPTLVATCPYDPHREHYLPEFKHWMQTRYGQFGPASFRYLDEKYGPEFIRDTFPRWGAK